VRLVSILNHEACRILCTLHSCSHRPNGQIVIQRCKDFKNESVKSNILWKKSLCG
jgi:hypothetical protein